jgi:hypothetical protein
MDGRYTYMLLQALVPADFSRLAGHFVRALSGSGNAFLQVMNLRTLPNSAAHAAWIT